MQELQLPEEAIQTPQEHIDNLSLEKPKFEVMGDNTIPLEISVEEDMSEEERQEMIKRLEALQAELENLPDYQELENNLLDNYVDNVFNISEISDIISSSPNAIFQKETLEKLETLHNKMKHHVETNTKKYRKQVVKSNTSKEQKAAMFLKINKELQPLKSDILNLGKLIMEIRKTQQALAKAVRENRIKK